MKFKDIIFLSILVLIIICSINASKTSTNIDEIKSDSLAFILTPIVVIDTTEIIIQESGDDLNLDKLFEAMCYVESTNGLRTLGDNGKALGILQMHEICVKEINQKCYGYSKWEWEDAKCEQNSKEMFYTYAYWLIENRYEKYSDKMSGEEYIARVWNGGYNISNNTNYYWSKVSKFLNV